MLTENKMIYLVIKPCFLVHDGLLESHERVRLFLKQNLLHLLGNFVEEQVIQLTTVVIERMSFLEFLSGRKFLWEFLWQVLPNNSRG